MKRTALKTYRLPAVLLIAAATALAFVSPPGRVGEANTTALMPSPREPHSKGILSGIVAVHAQNQPESSPGRRSGYVQRARVWSRLRQPLDALGDRLERKGKERVTLRGTVVFGGDSQARPAIITYEQKGRLRSEVIGGGATGQSRTISFEEDKPDADLDAESQSVVKTFLYDTAERFFIAHSEGHAMRHLGSRFRADDGTSINYTGAYYDIYELADRIDITGGRQESKLFFFNSDTLLLERVRYTTGRDDAPTEVEVRFSDWRRVRGQRLPMRITRTENARLVLTFGVTIADTGARAANPSSPIS